MREAFRTATAVLSVALLCAAAPAAAQDRASGPWWPSEWGPDDEVGATNRITPATIVESLGLVRTGTVYELGHPYNRRMPMSGGRTFMLSIPGLPTGGPSGANRIVHNDELVVASLGQVGTQFDGLGHVGVRMTMADGSEQDVFYNGFTLDEIGGAYGLRRIGVENVRPIVTRGILVDVPAAKGLEVLPEGYMITLQDVRDALRRQGLTEDSVREGDAVFFRTGWARHWDDPQRYARGAPGIGLEIGEWVVRRRVSMIGGDTATNEADDTPGMAIPVHELLVVRHGINNLENMNLESAAADGAYEFLFIFTPLRLEGATGSPGRPIGIR